MIYTYHNLNKYIIKDGNYLFDKLKKDNKKIISKDTICDLLSQFLGYQDFEHLNSTYYNNEYKNILYLSQDELSELNSNYKKYIEKYIHDGKFNNGYSCHFIFLDSIIPQCKRVFNPNYTNKLKVDLTNYKYQINFNEEEFKEFCFLFCDIKNSFDYEKNAYKETKNEFQLIFKYLEAINQPVSKSSIYENISIEGIKNNLNNNNKKIASISKEVFNHFGLNNKERFFYSLMRVNYILSQPYFFGNIYLDINPEIIQFSELKKCQVELYFHDKDINVELFKKLFNK